MRCSDVHAKLQRGGSSEPAVLEHLAGCMACQTLAEASTLQRALHGSREAGEQTPDLDAIWSGTRDALAREEHWSRRLSHVPTGQRIFGLLVAALVMLAAVATLMPRPDMADHPMGDLGLWLCAAIAASVVVLGAAVWMSYRPIHRPALPGWSYIAVAGVAMLAAWLPVILPPSLGVHPASQITGSVLPSSVACFLWGSVIGASLLALMVAGLRGDRRLGALPPAAFLAAGTFGLAALHLHCPIVDVGHMALGHSMVLTLLLVVPPVLRLRA